MTTLLNRLRARPIPSLIAVVALVLAVVFGVAALVLKTNPSLIGGDNEVVNTAGGYAIEVPDGWSSSQEDRTTKVTSPDGSTVITFGLGRTGPLPVAATMFFQQVGRNYENVQVFPPDAKKIGGLDALVYGGAGTNAKGTQIRFLAITVQNTDSPTNYGITVFTEANTDPAAVLPDANKIVDSFRELPPS